jgi:hypothetical protein
MYSLVVVEPRYVAAFFSLLWIGVFAGIRLPAEGEMRSLARVLTITMVLVTCAPVAFLAVKDSVTAPIATRHVHWQIVEGLKQLNVRSGDRVARIGGYYAADWARLLKVTVVAEVPLSDAQEFWAAPPAVQEQVIRKFAAMGATAVVAQISPDGTFRPGGMWAPLGGGAFYALPLRQSSDRSKS